MKKLLLSVTLFLIVLFGGAYILSITPKDVWYSFPLIVCFAVLFMFTIVLLVYQCLDYFGYFD
jgi:hypothetical protein